MEAASQAWAQCDGDGRSRLPLRGSSGVGLCKAAPDSLLSPLVEGGRRWRPHDMGSRPTCQLGRDQEDQRDELKCAIAFKNSSSRLAEKAVFCTTADLIRSIRKVRESFLCKSHASTYQIGAQ
jgi:hypothetical protein